MLRIGLIGGGAHSRRDHLPALAKYVAEHPGAATFAAFCDLRPEVVEEIAEAHGVAGRYTDLGEMLARERLDGCIAVVPIPAIAPVACRLATAGVPFLMEKPLGRTFEEARQVCRTVREAGCPAMVSVDRRFDPALRRGMAWRDDRPLALACGRMMRKGRAEEVFLTDTGIHAVDVMRLIGGDVSDWSVRARRVAGSLWYEVSLDYASGARGRLDVLPTCGADGEAYEMLGDGYRVLVHASRADSGEAWCWEAGSAPQAHAPDPAAPPFVRYGAYAEMVAFVESLAEGRDLWPTPADVLPSVELCHAIYAEALAQAGPA